MAFRSWRMSVRWSMKPSMTFALSSTPIAAGTGAARVSTHRVSRASRRHPHRRTSRARPRQRSRCYDGPLIACLVRWSASTRVTTASGCETRPHNSLRECACNPTLPQQRMGSVCDCGCGDIRTRFCTVGVLLLRLSPVSCSFFTMRQLILCYACLLQTGLP